MIVAFFSPLVSASEVCPPCCLYDNFVASCAKVKAPTLYVLRDSAKLSGEVSRNGSFEECLTW